MQMDKASIVGDAVLYIEDMQMQANKLKAEIADLEASLSGAERNKGSKENPKSTKSAKANNFISKTIIQVIHLLIRLIIENMFLRINVSRSTSMIKPHICTRKCFFVFLFCRWT